MNDTAANPSATPESQPRLKRPPKPVNWLLILVVLLIVVLGGGVTGFVFRSAIKGKVWAWRARGEVKQAEKLIQAGDWPRAYQLALAAHKLNPSSLEALRVLFRTATQTNSPHAINAGAALFVHPGSTSQEKLNLLAFFDLSQNDRYFLGLIGRLDETQRQQPDAQFLMIRYLVTRGRIVEAKKLLDAYFAKGGNEKRFQGLQARALLFGTPAEREQGQKLIATLMQEGDEVSKQAFGLLWDVPPALLRPEFYPATLREWVNKLPHPGTKERLIVAQLELAKAPNDKERQEAIFRQAVADFGNSDPEILCNWLTRFQKFELILGVVDEKKGRKSVPLFDHRMRALAVVQGVEAAEAWLANPLPEASSLQIWLSRAKLARQRKDRPFEQKCWKEALTVAGIDETSRQFLPVFRTAMGMHELDIASRALLEAALHPGASYPASLEIQPIIAYLYSRDRLPDLDTICRRILSEEPGNVVLANNVVYIALILGNPLENAVALSQELVKKFPKVLGFRTTLALALRKEKKSSEAMALLEAPESDWKAASSADLTIRSLVLEDCGETARAEAIRQQIDHKQLTGSERRAFAAVFKDQPPEMDPDQLYAEIRSWIVQGGQKQARQLLEDYFSGGGNERRFQALYAEILLDLHYGENDPIRGQELVAQLLGEADDHARKALALLVRLPADLIHASIFPASLQAWVRNLPAPVIAETIAAAKLDTLRSPDPATRNRILSDLVASSGKSDPEPVAALLSDLERYDLILSSFDERSAKASPKMRDYRLQALLKVKGAAAAQEWLDSFRKTDETPQAWLSTAKLRHGLGDATGTLTAFREASSLAERDQTANQFLAIYETAMQLGQIQLAIRSLLSASLHPKGGVPSVSELTPILSSLYGTDRLNDLHTVIRTLLNQDPKNDTLRNLQAYLGLILKDPTSRAADVAADLVKRHPNILSFRTTQALALTLEEKYEEAFQTLPRDTDVWNHASAADLAILALVQENMGAVTVAAATRARFEPDELSPTERRAFAAAKRKLPGPGTAQPNR